MQLWTIPTEMQARWATFASVGDEFIDQAVILELLAKIVQFRVFFFIFAEPHYMCFVYMY